MNLIVQNSTDTSVIGGSWADTTVVSNPVSGPNYNHIDRIFNDEVGAAASKQWTFTPNEIFASSIPQISEVYNSGGVLINRVTSSGSSRLYKLDNSIAGGVTQQKFRGYVAGSRANAMANIIRTMALVAGTQWNLFNDAATQWNRNCWGKSLDFSGIVVRSSYWGGFTKERGGALITPRHIIITNHYQIGVGETVRFIKKGATAELDQVITKILVAGCRFPNQSVFSDSYIYLLDSDVPAGINPFSFIEKVPNACVPQIMAGKLSDLVIITASSKQAFGSIQDIGLNQFATAANGTLQTFYTRVGLPEYVAEWIPYWSDCVQFIRPVLSGDSGSPGLNIISPTQAVVSIGGEAVFATAYSDAIQAVDAIYGISTGYAINVIANPPV